MFVLLILFFTLNISAQEITWKDNELTFAPQPISRFIAKNLPERWVGAQKVGGLYFKLNPFFFCRREPDGGVFCHLYIDEAKGSLQRMDLDSNYGQGSIDNYIEDNKVPVSKRTVKTTVTLVNDVIYVQFGGKLAERLSTRFFPEYEKMVEWNNQMYMKYQGDLIQCYHPVNAKDRSTCRIAVPIVPKKPEPKRQKPLLKQTLS